VDSLVGGDRDHRSSDNHHLVHGSSSGVTMLFEAVQFVVHAAFLEREYFTRTWARR
jgi:hypothetical protein